MTSCLRRLIAGVVCGAAFGGGTLAYAQAGRVSGKDARVRVPSVIQQQSLPAAPAPGQSLVSSLAVQEASTQDALNAPGAAPENLDSAAATAFDAAGTAASTPGNGPQAEGRDGPPSQPGIPNFHPVSPGLFRSGKPSSASLSKLKDLGVKTILTLTNGARKEREAAATLGIAVESVRMSGLFRPPTFEQMDSALAILMDPAKRPLLVHCTFGKDRTGFAVAAYRVVVEGMDIDKAVQEAKYYRCCLSSFGDLKAYLQAYQKHRNL